MTDTPLAPEPGSVPAAPPGDYTPAPPSDLDDEYWHALIDEGPTAEFLDLSPRTLQEYRRKGGGPRYVRISSRCVKYTRFLAWQWYMGLLRTSTADDREAA